MNDDCAMRSKETSRAKHTRNWCQVSGLCLCRWLLLLLTGETWERGAHWRNPLSLSLLFSRLVRDSCSHPHTLTAATLIYSSFFQQRCAFLHFR